MTASLRAAITEHGLDAYADAIQAAVLPSVRLVGTPAPDDVPVGASKLGGAPDLGEAAEWPRGDNGPLSFIGQVNQPAGGLLSFFYDAAEQPWGPEPGHQPGWQVLLNTGSLRRTPAPDNVKAFNPVALTPRDELTLPFGRTMEARAIDLEDDEADAYAELREAFDDLQTPDDGIVGDQYHRMFGHPDAIQGDMRRLIEADLRGVEILTDDETPELDKAAERWVLLLQVDSDDDAGMVWGDFGRLFFWITRDALAAGDFSAVVLQLQCY